jgi:hypothetical protein
VTLAIHSEGAVLTVARITSLSNLSLPLREGGSSVRWFGTFEVVRNGVALLRHFDIFKEAGASRGVVKTFRGLEPNGQGKLQTLVMPARNYANVFAIEVTRNNTAGQLPRLPRVCQE